MKSIKTKLVVAFSFLILAVTAIVGMVSIRYSSSSLKEEINNSLSQMAEKGAKLTESRLETLTVILRMIAAKKEIYQMGWEVDLSILKEELTKTDFLDIGYVLPNGYTHFTDGTIRLMSDRPYVQDALNGTAKVSDVIISRVTRKSEIEICVPVIKEGEIVGAIVGRKEADALGKITNDGGYGEKGYVFIINETGTVIAHPDTELVIYRYNPIEKAKEDRGEASFAKAIETMLHDQGGITDYKLNGTNYYIGYAPIKGTNWIFSVTANKEELLSAIPDLIKTILKAMVIIFFFSIVFVFAFDHAITKPLIDMTIYSKRIAEFDIRQEMDEVYLKKKDEIGLLSNAFHTLTLRLREIIMEITEATDQVTVTSQGLSESSQLSAAVSEDISMTVDEIAKDAVNQSNRTDAGSDQAAILGALIEKNHELMLKLNAITQEVMEFVNCGLNDNEKLSKITSENDRATKAIIEVINQTSDSTKQIAEASRVISDMARQTNLLALNASIEASRAGEAGKGFSVVAEEIQKMADQSAESTKDIDMIIGKLQRNVGNAVVCMKHIASVSVIQQRSVNDSIHRFKSIAGAMNASKETIMELNTSENEMIYAKDKILASMLTLSEIAMQNASGAQKAAMSMEEQTAESRNVADLSTRLSELAHNLKAVTERFLV